MNNDAIDSDYERRIKAAKSDFWYGVIIFSVGLGFNFAGMKAAACLTAFSFMLFLLYSLYKTLKFYAWFKNYWHEKGLDKKEINEKWRKIFPPFVGF